jgi:hypothetical protein
MTIAEFKAWFEGYTEEMVGPPSPEQWKRIMARVSELGRTGVLFPRFVSFNSTDSLKDSLETDPASTEDA